MASNPPGECCTKGVIHKGDAKGELTQYAGVRTYIAYPPSKSTEKVILFLTDVLGFYNNSKLLADEFAANGYLVVMPDILDNDPVPRVYPEGFTLAIWLARERHQPEFVQAVVDKTLAEIKKDFKPKKIGAVGYCFGAKYTTRLLDGRIDAGFTAHPSLVSLEEVAAIKAPLSIAAAEIDDIFTTGLRHQTEAKLAEIKATYQINLYGGMQHGFSVRSDPNIPKQNFAKKQAFNQAIAWFAEYLS